MQPSDFIRFVWATAPDDLLGSAIVWFKQTKETVHIPLEYLSQWGAEDDSELAEKIQGGMDAYTSPGLRLPGMQPSAKTGAMPQGGKRDIVALAGFVLDLDLAQPDAHKATNLPKDLSEASGILAAGPDPTIVIDSGNGIQCWWLFDTPFLLSNRDERQSMCDRFERFQLKFINAGVQLGFHVDKTATIQRVFRLPGALNHKTKPPKSTAVIYNSNVRYTAIELEPPTYVPLATGTVPNATAPAATAAPMPPPAQTPTGDQGDPVERVRQALQNLKPNHEHKEAITLLLKGESFASPGSRDEALQRLASVVAFTSPRDIEAEDLVEVFRPSLSKWAAEDDAVLDIEEELEKALDKIERAIGDREIKDAARLEGVEVIRNFIRKGSTQNVAPEDIEDAALPQFSIVQYRDAYWAYSFGEQTKAPLKPGFYGPFQSKELRTQLKDLWEGAPPAFSITFINSKGEEAIKDDKRITHDYATGAHKVVGHFELQDSYYDFEARTFHEAICPIRSFEPEFNRDIDEWLRVLGGDKAEKLIDWIAAVSRLDQQCCAMYLSGPPGCGKSLLASGLSTLWGEGGPTELESMLVSQFNAEMFRCPLIVLEEGIGNTRSKITTMLRRLTGTSVHTYNDKNVPTRKVIGNVRVLIAANNDQVLVNKAGEELTAHDLEAFIGRFLHIKVSREAAHWLKSRNHDRSLTESWVKGGLLAKHALYLRDQRQVVFGERFLVEGEATEMHRAMVTSGKRNGSVLEWLTRYATDPGAFNQRVLSGALKSGEPPPALLGGGEILINTQGLVDLWDIYMGGAVDNDTKKPSITTAGAALIQLSQGKRKLGSRGNRKSFHRIGKDLILSWAESNQVGQIDRMLENIDGPILDEWRKDDESDRPT